MSHRFFLPETQIKHPISTITGTQVNHIKNVLRLKPGDQIILFDGAGVQYHACIAELSSDKVDVELFDKKVIKHESPVHVTIAQAYLKEKKMDLLIRQITELGINKWQPFFSERSIPTPDNKRLHTRLQRWDKIMMEAVKQCRRGCLVEIGHPLPFDQMLISAKDADIKIIFWENADNPLSPDIFSSNKRRIRSVYSVLGPEGGFSAHEVKQARESGFYPVKIGPRILRAETAAVAACALLQYVFGDFGEKSLDKSDQVL